MRHQMRHTAWHLSHFQIQQSVSIFLPPIQRLYDDILAI